MGSADVKGTELRSCVLTLGAVDAAGFNLVRLAKELDGNPDPVDDAGPLEAWLLLLEASLFQVVL